MASKMTTKTLQELSELLNSEELCYKKCCNYVQRPRAEKQAGQLRR